MTTFINCVSLDRIIPDRYYRVACEIGVLGALLVESGKDNALRRAYDAIAASTDLVPTTGYSRAPGTRTLVIDCKAKTHATQAVADAANQINQADIMVDLVSVELLTTAPGLQAPAERQAVVDHIETERAASSWSLGTTIGGVTDTVKWVMIAVVAVVLVVVIKDAEEWI